MYKLIILISFFFSFSELATNTSWRCGWKRKRKCWHRIWYGQCSGTDHQDIRDGAAINTEHVSNFSINKKINLSFLSTRKFHKLRERRQRWFYLIKLIVLKYPLLPTNPPRNLTNNSHLPNTNFISKLAFPA